MNFFALILELYLLTGCLFSPSFCASLARQKGRSLTFFPGIYALVCNFFLKSQSCTKDSGLSDAQDSTSFSRDAFRVDGPQDASTWQSWVLPSVGGGSGGSSKTNLSLSGDSFCFSVWRAHKSKCLHERRWLGLAPAWPSQKDEVWPQQLVIAFCIFILCRNQFDHKWSWCLVRMCVYTPYTFRDRE